MSDDQLSFLDAGESVAPGEPQGLSAALHRHVNQSADLTAPYAAVAEAMHRAGWYGTLPLPPGKKKHPPGNSRDPDAVSYTGRRDAVWPTISTVRQWAVVEPRSNVALRLPHTMIGIDVDDYDTKPGAETLRALIEKCGPLPATWRSTARDPSLSRSGIYLYTVPVGTITIGNLPGIEMIQSGHRYAVVWPSTNPEHDGRRYQWYEKAIPGDPNEPGSLADRFPRPEEIPDLPEAWIAALSRGTDLVEKPGVATPALSAWLHETRNERMCPKVASVVRAGCKALDTGRESAHEVTVRYSRAIVKLAGEGHAIGRDQARRPGAYMPEGHPGGGFVWLYDALRLFGHAFISNVTREGRSGRRDERGATMEYERAIFGAVELATVAHALPERDDPECFQFDEAPEWIGPITSRGNAVPGAVAAPPTSRGTPGDIPAKEITTTHAERTEAGGASGEDTTPPEVAANPSALPGKPGRPELNVGNVDLAAQWLRAQIGRGLLAGAFKRAQADEIVFTPTVGHRGYVRPPGDDDDGPAQVRPFSKEMLAARIQYSYACYKEREAKEREQEPGKAIMLGDGTWVIRSPAMFPLDAARTALSAPDMLPHLRRLAGVIHTPAMRTDGSIIDRAGYDTTSKLLYLPEPGLDVPDMAKLPSPDDIKAARKLLLHMISDFPFITDHDRAAYLGLLLTPLMRSITPAPYKMFAISAHQAGSGKTLLATLARIIHGGVFKSEMPEDNAELRKQITTILQMTTGPVINFDNVTGVVRSSTLAGLVTSADWDDRKLGTMDLARCVNDRVWVLTGNNMSLGGDMVRRTIWVNIDPGMPDPQLRSGFRITNVEHWTLQHRGHLIAALLTLIRAWDVAGRPSKLRSSDGFGEWLGAINGILKVAGIEGTCDDPSARGQAEGEEDADWATFLEAIERTYGAKTWTAKGLLENVRVVDQNLPIGIDELPAELADKLARSTMGTGPSVLGRTLGKWLANRQGRWAGGRTVRSAGKDRVGLLWRIEKYTPKKDTQSHSVSS